MGDVVNYAAFYTLDNVESSVLVIAIKPDHNKVEIVNLSEVSEEFKRETMKDAVVWKDYYKNSSNT